jgi:tetratricopeptide (TPR) repeat protein
MAKEQRVRRVSHKSITAVLSALLLLLCIEVSGQDSRVEDGVKAFQAGDFLTALEEFDQALEFQGELTGDNKTKAFYYRGLAKVFIYNNAVMNNDVQLLETFGDAYLEAYNDLMAALDADHGTWQKSIFDELESMQPGLTQFAFQYFGLAEEILQRGDINDALPVLEKAMAYASASVQVDDNYMARDVMGQIKLIYGETGSARSDFEHSISLYRQHKPDIPDFHQAYVYYRLAMTYLEDEPEPELAIDVVKSGEKFIRDEMKRWQNDIDRSSVEDPEEIEELASRAANDLAGYKYELFYKYPELLSEGIEAMQKSLAASPNDYDLLVAYARLLENADLKAALEQYNRAMAVDPGREVAWYNAGVLHYNRGRGYYEQAGREQDQEKYDLLASSAKEHFEKAWPLFEKALTINPENKNAIVAMKNLALLLNRPQEYEKYSEMESRMRD